jgi:hypothetical protein
MEFVNQARVGAITESRGKLMKPRYTRVLVFAASLLIAPLLPAWGQAPVHPRPQPKKEPKPPQVTIKQTPVEQGDPQQGQPQPPQDQGQPQDQTQQGQPTQTPPAETPPATQGTPTQATPPEQGTQPAPGQAQATPAAPTPGQTVTPEQIGLAFAPPEGWQQGDPTKFSLPGTICCVWSPDNVASIAIFVQKPGKALTPRGLLETSAKALSGIPGAQIKTKELGTFGGLRGFSLVVTAPGNGAAIDGKGTVPTTQHWVAIPRQDDVVIFLLNSPDASFAQNDQALQALLSGLKITGTQTPDQQASK